jgi:creatinine amidohydrolase
VPSPSVEWAASATVRGGQALGFDLSRLTWPEAQPLLTAATVVVIPLGAATKEHGPHLPLNTDWLQAEYYQRRVLAAAPVVMMPTVGYSHYPAFVDYPGSVSLAHDTARDTIVDICASLARHGARRFYVINIGISTKRPLQAAAELLEADGVLLRYTDLAAERPIRAAIQREQEGGSHADLDALHRARGRRHAQGRQGLPP